MFDQVVNPRINFLFFDLQWLDDPKTDFEKWLILSIHSWLPFSNVALSSSKFFGPSLKKLAELEKRHRRERDGRVRD